MAERRSATEMAGEESTQPRGWPPTLRDHPGGVDTTPIRIELTPAERTELSARVRAQRMACCDVVHTRIVVLLAVPSRRFRRPAVTAHIR